MKVFLIEKFCNPMLGIHVVGKVRLSPDQGIQYQNTHTRILCRFQNLQFIIQSIQPSQQFFLNRNYEQKFTVYHQWTVAIYSFLFHNNLFFKHLLKQANMSCSLSFVKRGDIIYFHNNSCIFYFTFLSFCFSSCIMSKGTKCFDISTFVRKMCCSKCYCSGVYSNCISRNQIALILCNKTF